MNHKTIKIYYGSPCPEPSTRPPPPFPGISLAELAVQGAPQRNEGLALPEKQVKRTRRKATGPTLEDPLRPRRTRPEALQAHRPPR